MTLETEAIVERRRLRRRLTTWRVAAIVALVLAIGALSSAPSTFPTAGGAPRQIARISIDGMITEDRAQLRNIKNAVEAKHVDALLLAINSPGGTTTGGEAMFEALREAAGKKPVVAVMGTMATSAAYIVGLASDHIVARGNTVTGSVGVIFQWAEFSQLLDKLGVKMNEVKSGPLKANPSPFTPLDPAGKELAEKMVAESQKWFLDLVVSRRGIQSASVPGLEQGRVFSGREAIGYKLVDQIGGEAEAVRWLEEKRNVQKGLKVVDWKPRRERDLSFLRVTSATLSWLFGPTVDPLLKVLGDAAHAGNSQLDGLRSVWHPGMN